MSSIRAYRFALRAKPAQERQLRRYAGQLRRVWNVALAEQRARHTRGEKYAGFAQMCQWLTAWRNAPATAWLAEGPVHPQQQVLRRLDEAYRRFFAKSGGSPAFKRYGEEPGLRFPDAKQIELDRTNGWVKLPKLGWVRMRQSREAAGTLRNVSVSREGAKWYTSIQVGCSAVPALDVAPSLGIDLGLAAFAATSDGKIVPPLKALDRQQRRLKHAQRALARKKRGSANRKKAVCRLGNLHRRIARQRADWRHQLTTRLAEAHPVIAIEDLKVRNMSASAAGTPLAPGRNVRDKAGQNRGILDAAWGEFARQLAYKTEWRGGRVFRVNPAYTSRTCRICGHEAAENRKTQGVFACVACGHTEHADVHAAKNILAAGHAAWALERAIAQEPAACGGLVRRPRGVSRKAAAPVK
jgi:putative transposase